MAVGFFSKGSRSGKDGGNVQAKGRVRAKADDVKYVSTRGNAPSLAFDDIVIAGLASDGGLYLPERWPLFTPDALKLMRDLDYPALAARVIAAFAAPAISEAKLAEIATDAYRSFGHEDVAPLKPVGDGEWMLELFHGPTL